MTPEAALYQFLSGFDIPAYVTSSTPDEAEFPYLTYDPVIGEELEGEVSMEVNLWYYTDSEAIPNAKVREIAASIGRGGRVLPYDGGAIWVKRGTPWAQSVTNSDNTMVKRRYLNIDLEYI